MNGPNFDFYDKTSLKSYNLNESMRYQLNMLDNLDVFTRKHCENVASLTCRLCEYLHCNKNFTTYCTMCAYLHDLGKLKIPPQILQKPGKLTEEEYKIMKSHTTIGYEMCMNDLKLRPYAAGALYHHEALNGTGYPQGLTKNQIPYEGQIIRVADEYDAIVSKRQYKSHIGISDTLKILIENAHVADNTPTNTIANTSVSDALKEMVANTKPSIDNNGKKHKYGKNNPVIVKTLLKVIIDDIIYEISCTEDYIKNLKDELKRFKQIDAYKIQMDKAKKEKDKQYYLNGITILLKNNETLENYKTIQQEYENAYTKRKAIIENLYHEIKVIKKLKV